MSSATDLSGRKLGEYEITGRIGVGGMGVVYEGVQPVIGKRVAVKVLLPQFSSDKTTVERFLAEARAVNAIRHRGIVDIFSFGALPDGSHYFVMEFMEGEPFDRIIKRCGKLPVREALEYVDEMLSALGAAHEEGIIHRDIKPSNLFLVNTGRGDPYVKLLDFGIAKLGVLPSGDQTPQTRASVILGTPDYISPEQVRGAVVSPRTDLYAVGCVLYELITGRRVFKAENSLQTMWMHVEDKPVTPSTHVPGIPPELDAALLKVLEKKPDARFQSAEEMRQALEQIYDTLPKPPSGTPRVAMPAVTMSGRFRVPGAPTTRESQRVAAIPEPTAKPPPAPTRELQQLDEDVEELQPMEGESTIMGDGQGLATPMPVESEPSSTPPVPPPSSVATLAPAPTPLGDASSVESTKEHQDVIPTMSQKQLAGVSSKRPLLLVGLAAFVLGGVGLALWKASSVEAPKPEVVQPTPPTKPDVPTNAIAPPPEVVIDAGAAPELVPVALPIDAGTTVAKAGPDAGAVVEAPKTPKPAAKAITAAQINARLAELAKKLAAREADRGGQDKILRMMMDSAKQDAAAATTDAQRREVWQSLSEVASQLK